MWENVKNVGGEVVWVDEVMEVREDVWMVVVGVGMDREDR